jgi:trk system potassium uptake protein TrkH
VVRPVGWVMAGLGAAQAIAALAGGVSAWTVGPVPWDEVIGLGIGALAGTASGVGCLLYARRRIPVASLTRREALLAVALIWAAASIVAAIPFVIAAGMSPVDALFETISGFTTTGATVITHIERDLARPLLLWRSLIQWLGGMGIVVLMVAVLPTLGAGAKHMYRGEVAGTSAEGLKPRIASTSFTLWKLYAALTATAAILLIACGLEPFEAVCHSLTTMSTGGFSTHDASVTGLESPAVEYVLSVFMLLGSLNFGLYYMALRERSLRGFLRSTELRVFAIIVTSTFLVTAAALYSSVHAGELELALRKSLFQVVTFSSGTGFLSDDYMAYPPSLVMLFTGLMFIGGCSGSTTGGFKVERVVLLAKVAWAETRKAFQPNRVHTIRMGRVAVPREILTNVAALLAVTVVVVFGGVLFVAAVDGVPFDTAFGAALSCVANCGPAPYFTSGDHFADYSAVSKLAFALMMLLGRLEMFTLLAMLDPSFWRR